tara:strand:- start:124 stop:606 length:483 start_codon:yes stop_codon:yes gene_type:complete
VKYHKLSEIQFNEMHKEFAVFLATQSITKKDWAIIKYGKPELLDNYLNSFSDLVWDKILSDCEYLEYSSSDQLFLFHTKERLIDVLVLKIDSNLADLNTSNGFKKVLNLMHSDQIDIFKSSKAYTPSRNMFIYEYLKKGAMISKGKRYEILKSYFPNSSK